jgi:hypothetical protein
MVPQPTTACCLICKSVAKREVVSRNWLYTCPRCGYFALTGREEAVLPLQLDQDPNRRALLSHLVRRMQHTDGTPVEIFERELPSFCLQKLPTPQQQADSLILWVGNNQPYPDEFIRCELPFISAWVGTSLKPTDANSGGIHWLGP